MNNQKLINDSYYVLSRTALEMAHDITKGNGNAERKNKIVLWRIINFF